MKTNLSILLQNLKCNWSFELYDEILEIVNDELHDADTHDTKNFLKDIEFQTKSIKIQIESNF